jgi:hypothetical protein
MPISITTLSTETFSIAALSKKTFSITALSITTLSIADYIAALSIYGSKHNDTQHNYTQPMHSV